MTEPHPRIAIVLLNLGGPDTQASVKPFLFNLFRDPAILQAPTPIRLGLAWLLSTLRDKKARGIYALMGGGSPLLPNTMAQGEALQTVLADSLPDARIECFIAMRYWHPFTPEAVAKVKAFQPDRIILLPLYPQWSTTTTESSLLEWYKQAAKAGITAHTTAVCCYPESDGFITAYADLIKTAYNRAAEHGTPRVLFSAHGLPEKIVKAGDPYQWQCQQTAAKLVNALNIPDLDWQSTYQSRVGPLKWIDPDTEVAVLEAAKDKRPLVVAPIAFVSEHSETLVEIGLEYRELAEHEGCPHFEAVPAVGVHPTFIKGLAEQVQRAITASTECSLISPKSAGTEAENTDTRICLHSFSGCAFASLKLAPYHHHGHKHVHKHGHTCNH